MAIDFSEIFGPLSPTEEAKWLEEEATKRQEEADLPALCDVGFDWRSQSKRHEVWRQWRQDSTRCRADALFGSVRVRDGFSRDGFRYCPQDGDGPRCKNLWCECRSNNRKPFTLVPSKFIVRAKEMRPENPEATVSAFASWLYSLYSNACGDEQDRERGKAIEPAIFKFRKMAQGSVDNDYLRRIGSEWRLVHNGLHLPGQDRVPWFSINHLCVNGEPLRASPDLIYRHAGSNEVLIVEIKHSFMEIPSNLWPNLWGQLWCYSQLDIPRNANRVTVVGEVWGESTYWEGRGRRSDPFLHLLASERRDPRVPAYDRFFRTLFEIYCGHDRIL
jgi:hypothetical protein